MRLAAASSRSQGPRNLILAELRLSARDIGASLYPSLVGKANAYPAPALKCPRHQPSHWEQP